MASECSDGPRGAAVGDARSHLALWLRAGRTHRGMSLDDVAKVTKIQPRILERLEAGELDGLPAAVFVRGFVRSFARCVGLDEGEALRRYAACAIGSQDLTPTVRALVDAMADLAPGSAMAARATPRKMTAVEVGEGIDLAGGIGAAGSSPAIATAIEAAPPAVPVVQVGGPQGSPQSNQPGNQKKKRGRRRKARQQAAVAANGQGVSREPITAGTPAASPTVVEAAPAAPVACEPAAAIAPTADAVDEPSAALAATGPGGATIESAPAAPETADPPADAADGAMPWAPKMPPLAAAPSVPWRRPAARMAAAMPSAPSLVIDDADPDSAERALEERAETLAPRRSLLPPILLDREDRSARQGGLTLAVILLLIAATLTLSYLMRRPSASGDGMTLRETPSLRG